MYYVKKMYGYVLSKGLLDFYSPPKVQSSKWKHWVAKSDLKTCFECRNKHGEIYDINQIPLVQPPLHPNCRCKIIIMDSIPAGYGTKKGNDGADWWIKNYGFLPKYYITKEEIEKLGWKPGKNPVKFSPDMMITGGIYRNDDKHLPQAPKRIWYEADINYYNGKRNGHRLLWSNDGLIFITYDHYKTFLEIT